MILFRVVVGSKVIFLSHFIILYVFYCFLVPSSKHICRIDIESNAPKFSSDSGFNFSKFSAFHPPPGLQSFVPILMATFAWDDSLHATNVATWTNVMERNNPERLFFLVFVAVVLRSYVLFVFFCIFLWFLRFHLFIRRTGLVVDDSSIKTMASVRYTWCTYVFIIL